MKKSVFTLYGLCKCENIINQIVKDLKCEHHYFDVRLMLTEAITNAFKHGNKGDENKAIYLSYECAEETRYTKFKIKCLDNDLENIVIIDEITDDRLEDLSGRGLYLIKCLADEVYFKEDTMIIEKCLA